MVDTFLDTGSKKAKVAYSKFISPSKIIRQKLDSELSKSLSNPKKMRRSNFQYSLEIEPTKLKYKYNEAEFISGHLPLLE